MAQNKKSRIFAAALAFFFGMFGAHKFYLAKPGEGMIFMLIFIMGFRFLGFPISALLGVFDAFRLLTMDDATFDKKYNKGHSTTQQRRRQVPQTQNRRVTPPPRRSTTPARRQSSNNFSKSNPFKKSGIAKYKDFDLDGAIEDFKQGLSISENDVALHWNIACAYSLTEKKDKAYYHLNRAIELGFNDFEKIQTHDDLAFVRIQPEFEDFKANGYRLTANMSKDEKTKGIDTDPSMPTDDILLSQLNKLAELRKKGLLSEQEFVMERKKLLRR